MDVRRVRPASFENVLLLTAMSVPILAAYAGTLRNGAVWDDVPLLTRNPYLQSITGLRRLLTADLWTASGQGEPSSYYRPLTMLTFWANRWIGGNSITSYHVGNVLLHVFNTCLLVFLGRKVGGVPARVAVVVALLWALAPVCSEPVYWASGRFDLLAGSCSLLAILAGRMSSRAGLPLSLACVVAGLLSKESFTAFLPLLVLDDVGAGFSPRRRLAVKYAAIGTMLGAYLFWRNALRIPSLATATATGAFAMTRSFAFLVRAALQSLVWPTALDPFCPYVAPSSAVTTITVGALVAAVVILFLLVRKQGRNRPAMVALLGVLWFSFGIVPNAVVGPNLDMVGDRYAYVPLIGLALAVMGATDWAQATIARLPYRRRRPSQSDAEPPLVHRVAPWATGLALVLAMMEARVTSRRAADFRDDRTLAQSSLRSHEDNAYAWYVLAKLAAEQGDYGTADSLLARSLRYDAKSWRTWDAICFVQMQRNQLVEAESACEKSLSRHASNPRAWVNLASVYARARRWKEAGAAAERATRLKPAYAQGWYFEALAAANLGDVQKARVSIERGIEVDPGHAGLRNLLQQLEAF